ncbi:hypothetical protein M8494_00375 [Serratia ureilytica]
MRKLIAHHIIRADTFHFERAQLVKHPMLGAIGLVFFAANSLGWRTRRWPPLFTDAAVLRTPLLQAVGAFPTLVSAEVAFNKLKTLRGRYQPAFPAAVGRPPQTLGCATWFFTMQIPNSSPVLPSGRSI